jgi:hypothetical protein
MLIFHDHIRNMHCSKRYYSRWSLKLQSVLCNPSTCFCLCLELLSSFNLGLSFLFPSGAKFPPKETKRTTHPGTVTLDPLRGFDQCYSTDKFAPAIAATSLCLICTRKVQIYSLLQISSFVHTRPPLEPSHSESSFLVSHAQKPSFPAQCVVIHTTSSAV